MNNARYKLRGRGSDPILFLLLSLGNFTSSAQLASFPFRSIFAGVEPVALTVRLIESGMAIRCCIWVMVLCFSHFKVNCSLVIPVVTAR